MVLLFGIRPGVTTSRKYTAPNHTLPTNSAASCAAARRCCAHLFHWCVKACFQAAVISATVQVYRAQLHTLYINGPSIAAGHCYPGQDDKNGHCSGSFCGCKLRACSTFLRSLDYSLLDIFNCSFLIFFACSTAMTAQHRCYALLCIRCTSARRYKRWHARAVAMTSRKSSCKLNFFTTFSY